MRIEHQIARLQTAFGEDAAIDVKVTVRDYGDWFHFCVGPDGYHLIGECGDDAADCVDRLVARRWEIEARFGVKGELSE